MRLMWPWCIPVNGHLNTSHLVRVFLKTACLRCHGKIRTECWGLRTEQKVLPDARRLHMSVDEDDFTIINVKIYLTWQPPIIVSAFLPELWFASTYLQFGVICDILWYHRFSKAWFFADYLNIPKQMSDLRYGINTSGSNDLPNLSISQGFWPAEILGFGKNLDFLDRFEDPQYLIVKVQLT